MIENMTNARVISLRIAGVAIEVYAGVNACLPIADALIASVRCEGTWSKRTYTPINQAIKRAAGDHYHNWLKQAEDFAPKSAVAIIGDGGPTSFRNVVFTNGTRPVGQAMKSALQAADDKVWTTVTLPMVTFADSKSQCDDDALLLEIATELGVLLGEREFDEVKRIKVITPRTGIDFSAKVATAIAIGAQDSGQPAKQAKARKPRPRFDAEVDFGNITDFDVDALIVCIAPPSTGRSFTTSKQLEACSGDYFFKQLPSLLFDSATFHVCGKAGQNLGFKDVIFVVNDGRKSVPDYVETALRFADNIGMKKVGLPFATFIESGADVNAGEDKLLYPVMEGVQNLLHGGWTSLQLAKCIGAPLSK